MGAILDLWKSERGLVAVALIAAATAGLLTTHLTTEQWLDYTRWIFVTYVAAKTVTGAVGLVTSPNSSATTPPVVALAPPQIVKPPTGRGADTAA
jgi:hypothetical protein